MSNGTIQVRVESPGKDAFADKVLRRAVDVDTLKASLGDLASKLGQVIESVAARGGGLSLDSVEVGVEITAEGGVALVGSMKAGATASITLTFSRAKA